MRGKLRTWVLVLCCVCGAQVCGFTLPPGPEAYYSGKLTGIATTTEQRQQKSETRMTASVLKQDPNTQNIQKERYFFRTKHNMRIFGVIPPPPFFFFFFFF